MARRIVIALVLSFALLFSSAAETYANISEAAVLFLRIAAGARPAGMGEAFVAIADDATATHWNPAGLGRYPLSDLWLSVDLPDGRNLADVAVVENSVPEMNYAHYDLWVVTKPAKGYFQTEKFADPAVTPFDQFSAASGLTLFVDGVQSGSVTLPNGVFTDGDLLAAAFEDALATDSALAGMDIRVLYVRDGNHGSLRIYSGTQGSSSSVLVPEADGLSELFARGHAVAGLDAELMRVTPPAPSMISGGATAHWERGDVYKPDASEDLVTLVRTRTGLSEGPELDERVQAVAQLNQVVSTDSLRAWWEALQELPGATIDDSLVLAYDDLLAANDVLNVDPRGLQDVLNEMAEVVRDGQMTEDELYGLRVLIRRRAIVTYLPEELQFPFSFNLTGKVTALAAHKNTLWVGTSQGLLRQQNDRWTAMNDSLAGPAAGMIYDIQIAPSGAVWVATDQGVSRYTSSWTHFDRSYGWRGGACKRIFILGENNVFATDGQILFKWDGGQNVWTSNFMYSANVGDQLEELPGRLLGIQDSIQAAAFTDSLVLYTGMAPGPVEAGAKLTIPYMLGLRGEVLSMAQTSDHTLWFGTTEGLASLSPRGEFRRYGYAYEQIDAPTTVQALAERFVGPDHPDRAARLAERIKRDNDLDSDNLAAGRVIAVYNAVRGAAIHSVFADGDNLLVGTEFGMVEHAGKNWYRYLHEGLENNRVYSVHEEAGERWFATDRNVTIYAHPRKELSLMHVKWLPELANDLYYEYLAYVTHIRGWGTVGGNITFISLGTQFRTDEFKNQIGEFSTFEIAGTVSYGTRLSKTLAAGVSAKIIYSHLSDVGAGAEQGSGTATGFAVDVGGLWQTPFPRLTLGAAITNLGPNISYIDANQADPLPRNLAVGFAYRIINTRYSRFTLTAEMNKDLIGITDNLSSQADEAIFNGGLEYQYASLIALRAGYIYDRQGEIKTPTLGLGLQYKNYLLDFAYIPSSDTQVLANTTRLAASIRF